MTFVTIAYWPNDNPRTLEGKHQKNLMTPLPVILVQKRMETGKRPVGSNHLLGAKEEVQGTQLMQQ